MTDPTQPISPEEIARIRHETAFNFARNRLTDLGVYERFGECYWRDMLRNGYVLITWDTPGWAPVYCAFDPQTTLNDALHFMGVFL